MKTIPSGTILQSKGLGDTIGDIVESFNLDLSSNYGAIGSNRTKKVTTTGLTGVGIPWAFVKFLDNYYAGIATCIALGGGQTGDTFTGSEYTAGIDTSKSDLKIFNSKLYLSTQTKLWYTDAADNWSEATSGLAASPHIMESFKNRLYVTNNYTTILSINTSNALVTVGTSGAVTTNLSADWTITCLKRVGSLLWFGLLNVVDGTGKVMSWDGTSLDVNSIYELPSGVVAGVALDNVFYIMDTQGILKRYSGNSFTEVARLGKKNKNHFSGVLSLENLRYIHPNGIQTTDTGTILMLINNLNNDGTYEDTIPSGVWEYDPNVGLYHKYSLSASAVAGTSYNDQGQQRLKEVGAICVQKPTTGSISDNGVYLFGATYYTDSTASYLYGIFCDDTLKTTTSWSYFITTKIFANIQEQWSKIYTLYKKLSFSTSKIIIKYRTEEDTTTETTITWTDIDRFTSSVDLSSYAVGDEVQILQGTGSGQSSHIKEINGSTYILEDNFPTAVIGLTAKANVSHWIKAGEISNTNEQQFKPLTITKKNTSPWIQFKVCMQFNGKDELNKLQIISKPQVIEQ